MQDNYLLSSHSLINNGTYLKEVRDTQGYGTQVCTNKTSICFATRAKEYQQEKHQEPHHKYLLQEFITKTNHKLVQKGPNKIVNRITTNKINLKKQEDHHSDQHQEDQTQEATCNSNKAFSLTFLQRSIYFIREFIADQERNTRSFWFRQYLYRLYDTKQGSL